MKRTFLYFGTVLCLLAICSCGSIINPDQRVEEKFRLATTEDGSSTYGDYFTKLAGLRGEVKYQVFTAQGETNPDIKVIQVDIDKKNDSVEYKTAKIQYQFNEKTGFVKLAYLEVNGEAQNLLMGSMSLGLMMMESTLK
ncbi:MAG: hypothetical protein KDD36_11575 [Flavobacteriales bacterium]|nr:hypothetical protein [Flavobacteriales bacterium]